MMINNIQQSANNVGYSTQWPTLLSLILLLAITVSWLLLISPVAYIYGFRFVAYVPAYFMLLAILYFFKNRLSTTILLFSIAALTSSLFVCIFHGDLRFIFYSVNISLAFFFLAAVGRRAFEEALDLASLLVLILLIGACITFIHVMVNGVPEAHFETSWGRRIPRGIFSLGYEYWTPIGSAFRAASIYDEPGTFSFVICAIAAMRHLCNKNKGLTWSILILGTVTLSFAHILYMSLHFIAEKGIKLKTNLLFIIGFFLVFFYFYFPDVFEVLQRFMERFQLSDSKERIFVGDNRTAIFISSFEQIMNASGANLFFGIEGVGGCCNPLYPLAERGLFGAWPYYLILGWLSFMAISKKNWVLLGIALLLLQRPSVQSAGYSFLVGGVIIAAIWGASFSHHRAIMRGTISPGK